LTTGIQAINENYEDATSNKHEIRKWKNDAGGRP